MESDMEITNDCSQDNSSEDFSVYAELFPDLVQELMAASKEHEFWLQKCHDVKRTLKTNEAVFKELDAEVTQVTQESDDDLAKKQAQLVQVKKLSNELDDQYCKEDEEYCKEIESLTNQIAALSKNKPISGESRSSVDAPDVEELRLRKHELSQELLSCQQELEKKETALHLANKELDTLIAAIDEAEKKSKIVKSEIQTAKEENEELSEELILLESEINMKKSEPLPSGSKGNALFCEIDSKDKVLMSSLKSLKKAYHEKKLNIARLNYTREKLRLKYDSLLESKNCEQKGENSCVAVPNPEKEEKIKRLENELLKLEEALVDFPVTSYVCKEEEKADMRIVKWMVENGRKDLKDSREMIYKESADCYETAKTLCRARLENLELEQEILVEEERKSNLTAILKDINGPELKLGEDDEDTIQEYEQSETLTGEDTIQGSKSEQSETLTSDASTVVVGTSSTTENKDQSPLKFINIQRVITFDDFC